MKSKCCAPIMRDINLISDTIERLQLLVRRMKRENNLERDASPPTYLGDLV